MQRIVTVLDTALTVNYNDRPISTQKELDTYKFQFDDSWQGFTKTAVFYTDPAMVKHLLIPEDGVVTIPWEILTGKPQVLYIGVFGAKDSIIKPTTFGAVRLREGSYIDGVVPLPPTPDVYQQIISAWEGAKADEVERVANENSRRNNFDALVIEYNALKVALEQEITDGTASVDALEVLEAEYAAKALTLETTYAPRLGSVESQLAETASKADTATTKANAMASGSPKGVYATLVALQTAYPTGTTGAYLVTTDGKWYFWNGAWTAGGTYQSTGIANDTVTYSNLKEMPFIEKIKERSAVNLYDKSAQITENILSRINLIGTTAPEVSQSTGLGFLSAKIYLVEGKTYTIPREPNLYGGAFACAYNYSDTWLKNLTDGGSADITFVMPTGASYIRLYFRNQVNSLYAKDLFMLVEGSTLPLTSIPYGAKIDWLKYDVKKEDISTISLEQIEGVSNIQLFNPDGQTVEDGIIDNTWAINGTLTTNAGYFVSAKIPVIAGKKYAIHKPMTIATRVVGIMYNSKDEIVEWIYTVASDSTYAIYFVPQDGAYIRLSIPKDRNLYELMVVPGDTMPSEYIPYGGTIDWLKMSNEKKVDIALPTKIYGLVGKEVNIYFDNIIYARDNLSNYTIDVTCTIGKQEVERWTSIPTIAGVYPIKIDIYSDANELIVSVTSSIVVGNSTAGDGTTVSALFIGDSITDGGVYTGELINLFGANDPMNITLLGTRGTAPNLHEGRSGWSTGDYVKSATYGGLTNPFYNAGFDFANYMSAKGYLGVDYVILNLGINDIVGRTGVDDLEDEYSSISTANLETIISNIHAYDPTIKIGISLITPPAFTQNGFGYIYSSGYARNRYKKNNYFYVKKIIERFDNRQNENVYIVPINVNLDTVYGFERMSVTANSRTTETVIKQGDPIHPILSGKCQIADEYYYFFKCIGI